MIFLSSFPEFERQLELEDLDFVEELPKGGGWLNKVGEVLRLAGRTDALEIAGLIMTISERRPRVIELDECARIVAALDFDRRKALTAYAPGFVLTPEQVAELDSRGSVLRTTAHPEAALFEAATQMNGLEAFLKHALGDRLLILIQ